MGSHNNEVNSVIVNIYETLHRGARKDEGEKQEKRKMQQDAKKRGNKAKQRKQPTKKCLKIKRKEAVESAFECSARGKRRRRRRNRG